MSQLIARAAIYLLTLAVVYAAPTVAVSFDPVGVWLYLFLVPLAFVFALVRFRGRTLVLGVILAVYLIVLTGWNREGGFGAALVIYTYLSSLLVKERKIRFFLKGELFILAGILYGLLLFTYSSPETARENSLFGSILLFLLLAAFFTYGAVIFLGGEGSFRNRKGEIAGMAGAGVLILLLVLAIGADGVFNNVIPETLNDPLKPRPDFLDLSGNAPSGQGNLKGREGQSYRGNQGDPGGEGGDTGGEPRLLGVPGGSWQEALSRNGEGDPPRQYTVMIVESELSSTYLASRYFTGHDGTAGFTADEGNYLNEIGRMRYVETWKNPHAPLFAGREGIPVFVLSVEATRGVPYFPYSVEPTISDRTYYPFLYSWHSLSLVTDPRRMVLLNFIDSYPAELPDDVQASLQLDLTEKETAGLDDLLATLDWEGKPPYARLKALLNLYRRYQYNMGYTEDWTTGHILDFLENTREGDCTEFANGAALMARRMGIPARVVTGYLASEDLQTPNHKKALSYLKDQIPPLADKDLSRLFLVTTSHKHAWIQCWFPEYGWIDIETTGTAIPPSGSGDPNKLDVVIPMITETVKGKGRFIFPWRIVLRVILGGGVLLLAGAYGARIFLLIRLSARASRPGEGGYKAAYRLVLMRWADRGKPPRERQMTPGEYARLCPELSPFTEAFMEGVYGSGRDGSKEYWDKMKGEYRILFRGDRSLRRSMREAVSLKGLYYGFKDR